MTGAEQAAAWRKRHPERYDLDRARTKARSRALFRLAAKYPNVFERYFAEELEAIGVPRLLPRLTPEQDGRRFRKMPR